jgi:hypothetical protein
LNAGRSKNLVSAFAPDPGYVIASTHRLQGLIDVLLEVVDVLDPG